MKQIRKSFVAKILLSGMLVQLFSPFLHISYAAIAGDNIIITEVEYNPSGAENQGEWIELYNPTGLAISLSGWTLTESGGDAYTFTGGVSIGARDTLLAINDTTEFQLAYPSITSGYIDMEKTDSPTCFTDDRCLRLNNTGVDSVTLSDASATTIDYVEWTTYASAGNGQSIARSSQIDTDTGADWAGSQTPLPGGQLFPSNAPGGVSSNLELWLNSDSVIHSGSVISAWNDASGNGKNFTNQFSGSDSKGSFTDNGLNFNPVVSFDGTDGYLQNLSLDTRSFFMVYNHTSNRDWETPFTSPNSVLFGGMFHGDNTGHIYNASHTPALVRNGQNYVNGALINGTTHDRPINYELHSRIFQSNVTGTGDYSLGLDRDFANRAITGNIAEIISYSSDVTVELPKIESYLALKYGITLDQTTATNYVNSASGVVWNAAMHSGYNNHIIGIAQDDAAGLDQKVSKSSASGSFLTLSKDLDFTSSNTSATRTKLGDGNFEIIGNNGGATTLSGNFDAGTSNMLSRSWKVQETGSVSSVFVAIPESLVFSHSGTLLVSSDSVFDGADTRIPLTASGGFHYASVDFTSGQYFTFIDDSVSNALGSQSNPFTSLEQTRGKAAGTYNFNIGGNTFSTHLDVNGWILIASGLASTDELVYTQTGALGLQSDSILPSSTLGAMSGITGVRMNATTGAGAPIDVQTDNATVIARVNNYTTIGYDANNTSNHNWSGTGVTRLRTTCDGGSQSLDKKIWHSCGNGAGLHWIASNNLEGIDYPNDDSDLNLWVRSINVSPTDISLSGASINENNATNALIGSFSTTDVNTGDTHTYSLTSGSGDTDNSSFSLSGSTLYITPVTDFEVKDTYSIRVKTDDGNMETFEKIFTISVNDINLAPTDISLSGSVIDENKPPLSLVGTLSAIDDGEDSGVVNYSLSCTTPGADDAQFQISGTNLNSANTFDFETKSSHSICVRVSDGVATFDKNFSISIQDLDEIKPVITLTAPTKLQNAAITDTTISVTDNIAITAANVKIGTGSSATTSGYSCSQISATKVDCTLSIDASGNLIITASDDAGNIQSVTESTYIIDTVPPSVPSVSVDVTTPYSVNAPRVTFSSLDNVSVNHYEVTYTADDMGAGTGTITTLNPATSPVVLQLEPLETLHVITVKAFDTAGNSSQTVIKFPPIVTFTTPTLLSNTTITDSTVTISTPTGNDVTNISLAPGTTGASLGTCTGNGGDVTAPYAQPVTCLVSGIATSGSLTVLAEDSVNGAVGQNIQSYIVDTTPAVISVVAPTKLKNAAIADTTIQITDDTGILVSGVTLSGSTTSTTSNFSCSQTTSVRVDCTLSIDSSGDVVIQAIDRAGNSADTTESNYIIDTIPATITLSGSTPTILEFGSSYTDAGATFSDTVDGTGSIIGVGSVNTALLGDYTITYNHTDMAGNIATQVTRTVQVVDTTAPVVSVIGTNPLSIEYGSTYTDAGATFSDAVAGSGSVVGTGNVNTTSLGTYTIDYSKTDTSGNTGTGARVVQVVDTTAPVITLTGSGFITLETGTSYTDLGAVFTDAVDGTGVATLSGSVDIHTVNNYNTLTYTYTDAAGNVATPVVRVVQVVDTSTDSDGDGLPDLIELRIGTDPTLGDTNSDGTNDSNHDLDNVSAQTELQALNNGDGNGDGLLDAAQNTVTSISNSENTFSNTLEVSGGVCNQVTKFESKKESSLTTQDSSSNYALGLWDMNFNCTASGGTASVKLYLDKSYTTTSWVYKKYNSTTQVYTDISSSVTYGTETVGGTSVTTVSYDIVDGGPLDEDGLANGRIVDPSGPSIPVPVVVTSSSSGGGGGGGGGWGSGPRTPEQVAVTPTAVTGESQDIIENTEVSEKIITNAAGKSYSISGNTCPIIENIINPEYKSDFSTSFIDIQYSPEQSDIMILEKTGIVTGKESGVFAPKDQITRAEFLAIVLKSHCYSTSDTPTSLPFTDVDLSSWQSGVIKKGLEENIISGDNIELPARPFSLNIGQTTDANIIRELQQLLAYEGLYTSQTHGIYTRATTDAVYDFQKTHGIVSTPYDVGAGYWGPSTRSKFTQVYGGTTRKVFRPNDPISKIEALAIILNMRSIDIPNEYSHSYTDVAASWQDTYLSIGEYLDILDPASTGNLYSPNSQITREDMVGVLLDIMRLYK